MREETMKNGRTLLKYILYAVVLAVLAEFITVLEVIIYLQVFEKGFLQDVRHNLWDILPGRGRRSGLRQLNSGEISREVGLADCGNDFSNTL